MKIKAIICLVLLPMTFHCQQPSSEKDLVHGFMDTMVIRQEINDTTIEKYLDLHGSHKTKEGYLSFIKIELGFIKEKMNGNDFQVVSYDDAKTMDIPDFKYYEKGYGNETGVYFVVQDKSIITPVIVQNGKIISYSQALQKKKPDRYPSFMNKADS